MLELFSALNWLVLAELVGWWVIWTLFFLAREKGESLSWVHVEVSLLVLLIGNIVIIPIWLIWVMFQ